MHKKCISVAFVLTLACVVADSVNSAAPSQERIGGRTMMSEMGLTGTDPVERTGAYAGLLSAFRDSAADKPDEAMAYWFASDARSRWNVLIGGNMIPQQLTDFFMGGILLAGGSSRKGVVAGIYNPWWDALLLVRLSCRETKVGPEDDVFRKVSIEEGRPGAPRAQITEFFFLSGETFRGESVIDDKPSIRTVVPENDPLAVELWRVTSGTRKRFEELFPIEGQPNWGNATEFLFGLDNEREMQRIQTRSAVRLKLTLEFIKNAREVGIAAQIAELVRHGSHYRLCNHFTEQNSRPLLKTLSEMPEMFRKNFIPYGHVATADATLYIFINPKVPRLFATATLPNDRKKTPPSLEWYDLLQSNELLAAWNTRKDVMK